MSASHGKSHGPPAGGGHEEAHEGAPEWLISFADNVALMMGFFVILLAMNMRPTVKTYGGGDPETGNTDVGSASPAMLDWALALREAFNNPVQLDSTDPDEAELVGRLWQRLRESQTPDPAPRGRHDSVQTLRPSEYFGLGGLVLFDQHQAELSESALASVRELAEHLRGLRTVVEVRGHCSAPEAYVRDDKGLQFSWERAIAVARALADHGVDWSRLHLIACGRNDRRTAHEYDALSTQANQCVEVVITSATVPD